MTRRALLALVLAVAAGAAGCGYSLRGNLPSHLKTIAVPVFRNLTTQPNVENFVTRAVVNAFVTNSGLKVVQPEVADAILEGEVTAYELQQIAYDAGANVQAYRLLVTMNLRLRDVRRNEMLLDQRGVQERADFRAPGNVALTTSLEEAALSEAAQIIGRAVVAQAVERF